MHGEAQGTETRSATIQMTYRNRKIRYTGESERNSKKKISDPRKSKENRNEKQREKNQTKYTTADVSPNLSMFTLKRRRRAKLIKKHGAALRGP